MFKDSSKDFALKLNDERKQGYEYFFSCRAIDREIIKDVNIRGLLISFVHPNYLKAALTVQFWFMNK